MITFHFAKTHLRQYGENNLLENLNGIFETVVSLDIIKISLLLFLIERVVMFWNDMSSRDRHLRASVQA